MNKKTVLSLLMLSALCAAPASANYFSNPQAGTNLNIGSAPNPTPADLRALYGESEAPTAYVPYVPTAEAAPPPAPAPAPALSVYEPPVAAPLPPAVRQFTIFFDFDKSNLSPEARQIVGEAVKTAKEAGPVRIMVTGHTDTVGSYRYNQNLSERRALAVKSEMVRAGMSDADIVTVGKSFSEPLVATGPGVREPQNRRAIIDLGNVPVVGLEN